MEIPQHLIKEALKIKNQRSKCLPLNRALKKLEKFTTEEILIGDKRNEINKIDNEVRTIYYQIITSTNFNSLQLRAVLNSLNNYLLKGITNNDSKSIVIFLFANCYFMINPSFLLKQDKILEISKKKISKELFTLLSKIKFDALTRTGAPRNELKLFDNYKVGTTEYNIEKVYNFIDSLERGGRGFHVNYLLERLTWFNFYLNYRYYNKLINQLVNPQDFVFYFQSLDSSELIKVANTKNIINSWANFELIRQIVEKSKSLENKPKLHIAIYNILLRIKKNNSEFFKQTISYFERNPLFNSALGKLLSTISQNELKEIFEILTIDKYVHRYEAKKLLLNSYAENSSDRQLNELLSEVFTKWNNFIYSLFLDKDFYTNDLVQTDYCDYIVEYFVALETDMAIIVKINKLLDNILNIDSIWFQNSVNQITHYYLYLSQLYLLSYAYKHKEINNPQILSKTQKIRVNSIMFRRFNRNGELSNIVEIIWENVNWQTS